MADTDRDIAVLNSLISTTLDSQAGFLEAAEDARDSEFASTFQTYASNRAQAITLLQQEVRRQGGDAEEDGSLMGAAHRSFMQLKEVFVSRDDNAILEEVERGENYLRGKYDEALASDISGTAREVISKAYASVRSANDRVQDLKDPRE